MRLACGKAEQLQGAGGVGLLPCKQDQALQVQLTDFGNSPRPDGPQAHFKGRKVALGGELELPGSEHSWDTQ